jgi:triosephosphate isomerase
LIAANWKMYKTPEEACTYAEAFVPLIAGHKRDDIVVCPTFLCLGLFAQKVQGSGVLVGAQDMHSEKEGAYTGEISAPMLKSVGVTHVILGHSERRHYNGETDWDVNRKLHAALRQDVVPIVCIGEVQEEREEGRTNDVLLRQLKIGLEGIRADSASPLVIAEETHAFIRGAVRQRLGADIADGMRILYGGSVKPENIAALMQKEEIDGALVGGASLDAASFAEIVQY